MKPNSSGLKRVLGKWNLTSLGVGAIIGAGIFVITGQAAAQYAGPGILISFVLSGIACLFAGLCYGEFASMYPVSGSAYTYALATMGKFMAWIIGWDLVLEYLLASSTVAVGWSGYVTSFLSDFGIHIPQALSSAPFAHTAEGWVKTGALINLPAMFILSICTLLILIGIQASARINNVVVILKVSVILLFILFGFSYINLDNLHPIIPPNTGEFGHYGWSGILRGAAVIFFAYLGFDAVSTTAQEAKNPQKDLPFGMLASLSISTVLYILVSIVLLGLVPYQQLNVPDPIAVAVNSVGPSLAWLRPFVKCGAIAGLTSVILVMLLGQTRIFYAMSRDGFLPKCFSNVHSRFSTPHVTTLSIGVIAILISGLLPISVLGELVSIGTLFAFVIVCSGVLILRFKRPDLERPFKTPFVGVVAPLGAFFALVQMLALPKDTWIRLVVWMLIGIIIYMMYGRKYGKSSPDID